VSEYALDEVARAHAAIESGQSLLERHSVGSTNRLCLESNRLVPEVNEVRIAAVLHRLGARR